MRLSKSDAAVLLAGGERRPAHRASSPRRSKVPPVEHPPFILPETELILLRRGLAVHIGSMQVDPQGAPRINGQGGRFTDTAKRYYAYKDQLQLAWRQMRRSSGGVSPRILTQYPCVLAFWFPMPASWSGHERRLHDTLPHGQKPDIDNCLKAVLDTMLPGADAGAWDLRGIKRWSVSGEHGSISLYVTPEFM